MFRATSPRPTRGRYVLRSAAFVATFAFLLGACGDDAATTEARPTTDGPAVAQIVIVSGDGLVLEESDGSSAAVPFGTAQDDTIAQVTTVLGAPTETGDSPECPFGPAEYTTFPQIGLTFADGEFIGWSGGIEPGITTADGIGVGSTREELEATATVGIEADSTLGVEFGTDTNLNGTLTGTDPTSTIEGFWGGMVCIYR